MSITQQLINALVNDKKVYADVIDIGSRTATVQLVGSGAKLANLLVSGESVTIGDRVVVLWDGTKPYILSGNSAPTTSATAPSGSEHGPQEEDPAQSVGGYEGGDLNLNAYDDLITRGKIAAGSTIWTTDNHGEGSGLHADLLDDLEGSAYLKTEDDLITGQISTEETAPGNEERLFIDADGATYRFWVGAIDPADAPFGIYKTGGMRATGGDIGGWDITASTINKNNVTLDSTGKITVGTGNNVVVIDSTDGSYLFWAGHASSASAPFRVTAAGVVYLDSAYVSGFMQSSTYQSGLKGWKLQSSGRAEFQNISARGEITGVIFKNEVISMFSGRNRVAYGDVLTADCADSDNTITVATNDLQSSDICQIKTSASVNEWMMITSDGSVVADGYEYNVIRDLDGSGANNHYKGAPIAALGSATVPDEDAKRWGELVWGYDLPWGGDVYEATGGFLTIDGSRTYGPYFGVARRFGAAHDQIEDVARFGRLYGFLGESREVYGIAMGDLSRYLKYTYTDGLSIQTANGATIIDDDGIVSQDFGLLAVADTPDYTDGRLKLYIDSDDDTLYGVYKNGATEYTQAIAIFDGGLALRNVVEDTTPQLGGNLDANDKAITDIKSLAFQDGGSTVDIVRDEDDMASDDAYALATQQSIKAYVDALETNVVEDTTPQLGGNLDAGNYEIQNCVLRFDQIAESNSGTSQWSKLVTFSFPTTYDYFVAVIPLFGRYGTAEISLNFYSGATYNTNIENISWYVYGANADIANEVSLCWTKEDTGSEVEYQIWIETGTWRDYYSVPSYMIQGHTTVAWDWNVTAQADQPDTGDGYDSVTDVTAKRNLYSTLDMNDYGITNIKDLVFQDGGSTVDIIRDEDNMASNDAAALATQQSIKAYTDTEVAKACFMETGEYTGDGAREQIISLADTNLKVKHVMIFLYNGADANNAVMWTNDKLQDATHSGSQDAQYLSGSPSVIVRDDRMSLGTGQFIVDDGGSNSHPNQSGDTYYYTAWGTH